MYAFSTKFNSVPRSAGFLLVATGVVVFCLMFTGQGHAADNGIPEPRDTIFYEEPPSAEALGQHLFPDADIEGLTRAISFKESPAEPSPAASVSMPILFHFGKTTIVEESRPFLDRIGQMLNRTEYANQKLIVEGHTDAVGSDSSNQRLSELRALAIKEYLVTQYSIDPLRLFPLGRGESRLMQPEAPTDGVNRRVEFLPYRK